jgi:RimJ/RimL family protein N-acetyltransferase
MLEIKGERIYLRDHTAADLGTFHAWMNDPVVTRYLSQHSESIEQSLKLLSHAVAQNKAFPRKDYFFAVVELETGQIVGEAGFSIQSPSDSGGVAEMGFFLFQPYWGKGYASEAAKLIIDFGFSELSLHKITAGCDARNLASEKVMIHCGMQKEAHFKLHRLIDGVWSDRVEYAILRSDWVDKSIE